MGSAAGPQPDTVALSDNGRYAVVANDRRGRPCERHGHRLRALGTKRHFVAGNGMDASTKDGATTTTHPVSGLHLVG